MLPPFTIQWQGYNIALARESRIGIIPQARAFYLSCNVNLFNVKMFTRQVGSHLFLPSHSPSI